MALIRREQLYQRLITPSSVLVKMEPVEEPKWLHVGSKDSIKGRWFPEKTFLKVVKKYWIAYTIIESKTARRYWTICA